LEEVDDILFALGLAPLRAWYLELAARLSWSPGLVFECAPRELLDALDASTALESLRARASERRRARRNAARLTPPPVIVDGRAELVARHGGRDGALVAQAGWGSHFSGPICVRSGLDALLTDPPPPGAIVCIPALTAPAALALHRMGIRAVCTTHGGRLSHGSLVARELGLSALIGHHACMQLPPGAHADLDPTTRTLRLRP